MPKANIFFQKAKEIDYSKFFLQTAIGLFLITFIGQVVGGYVVNRIEENRNKNKKIQSA